MKKLITIVFLLFCSSYAKAQDLIPTRSVFLELGGAGLPYSFNYDFRFDKTKMDSWGMRVGVGGYATENESFFSLPVMVNKLYGKGPHYFEMGLGMTFFAFDENRYNYSYCANGYYDSTGNYICNTMVNEQYKYEFILPVDGSPSVMGTMNFGYRRVPVDGGFTWRLNLTPIFNNNGFWPLFAGAGFGYAF
ncbi:hypothetical protein SAMN03080617_00469 [Algoriphagus alkaliphilus]|uniref:Outer membrane protein beta-barrel domain-containing protein n=1 Tax=Algoriphagus alkaliphilus TaxID=279824 RepID=A0A1G5VFQ7_9BACT|nr:hypothetical protein [Algoriphagus alkaliphilus]MBA4299750.1 hypothetical protein [Cyclobacterium sp.]SDA44057.1 hypothetical protein SAMN03080617_00469 [Algoriphagus alkaliphilus]